MKLNFLWMLFFLTLFSFCKKTTPKDKSLLSTKTHRFDLSVSDILLKNDQYDKAYSPNKLIDDNYKTAWCTNKNSGIGEKIIINTYFLKPSPSIILFPGVAANKSLFFANNRIKKIRIKVFEKDKVAYQLDHTFNTSEYKLRPECKDIKQINVPKYCKAYYSINMDPAKDAAFRQKFTTEQYINIESTCESKQIRCSVTNDLQFDFEKVSLKIPEHKFTAAQGRKVKYGHGVAAYLISGLSIEILEIDKGSKYDDTCVSWLRIDEYDGG